MRTDGRLSMALARMTEKKFLAALAVATVGLVLLLAGGVAAKPSHCAKDCKQDIKSCLALVPNAKSCTGTRAEKKACRRMYAAQRKACRGMVKLCKQQNPSLSGTCVLSSTTTTSTTTSITTPSTTTTTTRTSTSTTIRPSSTTTSTSSTTSTTLGSGSGCLPATGQTMCWNSDGTVIPCAGTGWDGDLQEGAPLSYTDNGDGTVTDNVTGLMWEKQSNGDGSIHDRNNLYTWDRAFSGHVATLNTMSFAGHTDWRVPNYKELTSILNLQNFYPAVSPAFNTGCTARCTVLTCSCTVSGGYWSSSTYAGAGAWFVVFNNAFTEDTSKSTGFLVRGVRGGSSCLPATGQTMCWNSDGTVIPCAGTGQDGDIQAGAPLSYTDNGDGTITDNDTGLVWEKQSNGDGSIHDMNNLYTWDQAFSVHVAGLNTMNFAGHTDWRVPNYKELTSILNLQNLNPAVSPAFNTGCTASCTVLTCSCTVASLYWSSSTLANYRAEAWFVDFSGGFVSFGSKNPNDSNYFVRGVRGGS